MSPRRRTLLAYGALALMPLFYSTNLVIGRAAVAETGPWTLAFLRWALATALLAFPAAEALSRYREDLLRHWRLIVVLGALGQVICGGFVYWALQHTTATNATLIYTTSPIFIVVLERLFGDERLAARRWAGILIALGGALIIVARGEIGRLAAFDLNPGDAGIAVAAVAWAGYSVLLKRPLFQSAPLIATFAAISATGTLLLAPFMVAETVATGRFPISATAWTSILGLALVPSILAYGAYQYGVDTVGAAKTGVFLYLLPVYGVLLAVVFLGESFATYHAVGFACVMLGVLTATSPSFGRPPKA